MDKKSYKWFESAVNPDRYTVKDTWPVGISDGLSLNCSKCGSHTNFDYGVTDNFWKLVVPDKWKQGVLCLFCLDELAEKQGRDVSKYLVFIQYTGIDKTILLKPSLIFRYKKPL